MEKKKLLEQVELILDSKIRPALKMHAGGITVLDFDEKTGTLKVKMEGTCHGCGFAEDTLYGFVEEELRANLPDIVSVFPDFSGQEAQNSDDKREI